MNDSSDENIRINDKELSRSLRILDKSLHGMNLRGRFGRTRKNQRHRNAFLGQISLSKISSGHDLSCTYFSSMKLQPC